MMMMMVMMMIFEIPCWHGIWSSWVRNVWACCDTRFMPLAPPSATSLYIKQAFGCYLNSADDQSERQEGWDKHFSDVIMMAWDFHALFYPRPVFKVGECCVQQLPCVFMSCSACSCEFEHTHSLLGLSAAVTRWDYVRARVFED